MKCDKIYMVKPTVDESAEACDGDMKTSDCVTASKRDAFLRIREGDTLTEVIKKISYEIEMLRQQLNKR